MVLVVSSWLARPCRSLCSLCPLWSRPLPSRPRWRQDRGFRRSRFGERCDGVRGAGYYRRRVGAVQPGGHQGPGQSAEPARLARAADGHRPAPPRRHAGRRHAAGRGDGRRPDLHRHARPRGGAGGRGLRPQLRPGRRLARARLHARDRGAVRRGRPPPQRRRAAQLPAVRPVRLRRPRRPPPLPGRLVHPVRQPDDERHHAGQPRGAHQGRRPLPRHPRRQGGLPHHRPGPRRDRDAGLRPEPLHLDEQVPPRRRRHVSLPRRVDRDGGARLLEERPLLAQPHRQPQGRAHVQAAGPLPHRRHLHPRRRQLAGLVPQDARAGRRVERGHRRLDRAPHPEHGGPHRPVREGPRRRQAADREPWARSRPRRPTSPSSTRWSTTGPASSR